MTAWETTRDRLLQGPQYQGFWGKLLQETTLRSIEPNPAGGDLYLLAAPAEHLGALERLQRRLERELGLTTGRPAAIRLEAAEPTQEEAEPPPPAEPLQEEDTEPDELPAPDLELEQRFREAVDEANANALAKFNVRKGDDVWAWRATSAYEVIFWGAYLGPAFWVWFLLRAYGYAGLPWPSNRDIAESVKGAGGGDNKRGDIGALLEKLKGERLIFWQESEEEERTFEVQHDLPLLTPAQVQTLSNKFQKDHKKWLLSEKIFQRWEASTEPTFVPRIQIDGKVVTFQARTG